MPDPFRDADAPVCDRRTPWYAWVAPFAPHVLSAITSMLVVGGAAALDMAVFGMLMFILLVVGGMACGFPLFEKKYGEATLVASLVLPGLWLGSVLAILGYVAD